ncbi:MAG TPA: hypothetical protein PLR02_07315 [Rhodocyclaceae bacterium]|nr:hypothetical protein [Rhodocyclaceae bacterium]
MNDLANLILAKLARASSKRPARAADVAALVGGHEPDFWRALEQLVVHRQVATAHIQRPARDPEPWLAIWPTGLHAAPGGWTGNSHSCLFVPTTPTHEALHAAQAPRVRAVAPEPDPAPVPAVRRPVGELQKAVLTAARGRSRANALRFVDLGAQLNSTNQTLVCCVRRLASQGRLGIAEVAPRGNSRLAVYDLAAEAKAVATEVAA